MVCSKFIGAIRRRRSERAYPAFENRRSQTFEVGNRKRESMKETSAFSSWHLFKSLSAKDSPSSVVSAGADSIAFREHDTKRARKEWKRVSSTVYGLSSPTEAPTYVYSPLTPEDASRGPKSIPFYSIGVYKYGCSNIKWRYILTLA